MDPHGSSKPTVYFLGEGPGADEDRKGRPFVGRAGRVLHEHIPREWLPYARFSNVVNCRPPDNREPTDVEAECCRPRQMRDIEATKPRAIFGLGNVPLQWAIGQTGISKWNGRRIPIKVGDHTCWFFPMFHPSYVMRSREDKPEVEFLFEKDMQRAFAQIESLPEPVVHTEAFARSNIECVYGTSQHDLDQIIGFLQRAGECPTAGFDYETNGKRPYGPDAKILTCSVSAKIGTMAFAVDHPQAQWTDAQLERLHQAIRDFHFTPTRKAVHSLAFEMEWSAVMYGPDSLRGGPWDDTLSQAYLLDSRPGPRGRDTVAQCFGLGFLSLQYFCLDIKTLSNIDRTRVEEYPLEDILPYNAIDAKYHRLLGIEQSKRIKEEKLTSVYNHQLRRIPTLTLTQIKGIPIDQKQADKFLGDCNTELEGIEQPIMQMDCVKQFKRMTGKNFRPTANEDIKYVIKKILGHYDIPDAAEETLKPIGHEFTQAILDHRELSKMISTYIKPFASDSPHVYNGVAHPILSTTNVRTWRTSCNEPNAQNQPKHGKGKILRKQVRHPNRNIKVIAVDYGGMQARNVAMESGDPALVEAFHNHYDIHTDWAQRLIRKWPKWVEEGLKAYESDPDVKKKYRQRSKNEFVFASFFGAHPPSLARHLGIPENKVTEVWEDFWDKFPNIKDWHERSHKFYYKHGYVTGKSGFRRYAPVSPNEIINTPIQSDESIIVLDAMNRLSEKQDFRFQANLEVHDDLTFLWHKDHIDRNLEVVIPEMLRINFDWINVPLEIEVSVGDDWYALSKVGVFESVGKDGYREVK